MKPAPEIRRKPTKVRHWKQRFDPDADLIFLKRLRMGTPENPFVMPGDPVTQEHRENMGAARLQRWWNARVVGLAEWFEMPEKAKSAPRARVAKKKAPRKKAAAKKTKAEPKPEE